MSMKPIAWCPVMWIAAAVLPATASGAILTFAFEGQVDVVNDRHGLLPFVHVGDPVTYTFSFDSDAPDTNPYTFAAEYQGLTASLKAGSLDIECPSPTIIIQHPGDVFDVESNINVSLPGLLPGGSIYFALIDQAESNALTDTTLPLVPYDLAPWAAREFSASFILPPPAYSEAASFWGHIDRFYAVPEPATLTLVLAGGLLVLARRRPRISGPSLSLHGRQPESSGRHPTALVRRPMRRSIPCLTVLLAAVAVLPATASGSILTFAFDGQVDVVDDRHGLLPFVHVGDAVTYTFSFDSDAPDTNPVSGYAVYYGLSADLSLVGLQAQCLPPKISIGHPSDLFDVVSRIITNLPGLQPEGIVYFVLSDQAENNAVTDTALPLAPYDLTPFASREFSAVFILPPPAYSEAASFWGHIDRFYAVPEPATVTLVLAGGLLILARRRRRTFDPSLGLHGWQPESSGRYPAALVRRPMHRSIPCLTVLLAAAAVLPATASGSILMFAFEGQVDVVDDRHGLLPFVHVGDTVTYTFSFDSDAPDTYPSTFAARYQGLAAFLKAGSMDMECPPPTIIIQHPGDLFEVRSNIDVSLPGLQPGGSIYFALGDQADNNALTDTALPLVPYDLTPFASRGFSASFILPPPAYSEAASFWGHIDRFYAVPEPATLTLVLAGGLLVLARRRPRTSGSS